jgi:hypothetical protein
LTSGRGAGGQSVHTPHARNPKNASEKTDFDLKLRQAELLQLMAQEQSRWTAFTAQLEALEKALTPIAPRR